MLSYQCKDEGEFVKQTHGRNQASSLTLQKLLTVFCTCVFIETRIYGILEVDGDLRVLCMKEKPLPTETKSRRAVSSLQTLKKSSLVQKIRLRS